MPPDCAKSRDGAGLDDKSDHLARGAHRREIRDQGRAMCCRSCQIEAIGVRHLRPRGHEVGHEFPLGVGGAIDFGKSPELGV